MIKLGVILDQNNISNILNIEEKNRLAPYAFLSNMSKGKVDGSFYSQSYRLTFQRDRDKILHSKFFRRLKGKTQVFLSPVGDHYRTRLTHTLEVSQIARTISRALRLNEDLTEAIALGHDLGHTPFGHMGERVLNHLYKEGFHHAKQSERIAKFMNLSLEVVDGILKHTKGKGKILSDDLLGLSIEAQVVRLSDIIAYINHDFDDAKRADLVKESDIPKSITKILGDTGDKRLNNMIASAIFETLNVYDKKRELKRLYVKTNILDAMSDFRSFMFNTVYEQKALMLDYPKVERLISGLYKYYIENPKTFEPILYHNNNLENKMKLNLELKNVDQLVVDYIAGMTDNFAIQQYHNIYLPSSWSSIHD